MAHGQGAPVDAVLLDATAASIARWGIERTTLERIAAEAGLSRATVYRRRVSRDQLISALTARAAESFRAAVWPALTGTGRAADRLRAALEATCRVADEYLHLLGGLFLSAGEVFHEPGQDGLTVDVFAGPYKRLLLDGAMDGTLREVPATVTASVLFNTLGWGYVHLRASHGWDADRAREAVIDLVLLGLLPPARHG